MVTISINLFRRLAVRILIAISSPAYRYERQRTVSASCIGNPLKTGSNFKPNVKPTRCTRLARAGCRSIEIVFPGIDC
jgi:hypothetical protein